VRLACGLARPDHGPKRKIDHAATAEDHAFADSAKIEKDESVLFQIQIIRLMKQNH
jgi:hypothetical protein